MPIRYAIGSGGGGTVDTVARTAATAAQNTANQAKPRLTWGTQTASFTAAAASGYLVNAATGACTVTLPATNASGDEIHVKKSDSSANLVTVSGTINGTASATLPLRLADQGKTFVGDGTGNWDVQSGDLSLPTLDTRYSGATPLGINSGMVSDGQQGLGGITNGQAQFVSTVGAFSILDVGKAISIQGAGASGTQLVTTISGWTNSSTVTLAAAAGTTVSGAKFAWGTDNGAKLSAAIDSAYALRYYWSYTGMTNKTGSASIICPSGGEYFFATQPFPAKQRDDADPTYGLTFWSPGECVCIWGGASTTPMTENDAWLAVNWMGFRFLTITPGATWERPRAYPAQTATGGATTSGTNTLTITGGVQFQSTMTSFRISIPGAGAGGTTLITQATYVSATSCTLAVNASTTVSGANVLWNRWLSGVTMENRRERIYWRGWNTIADLRGTNNNSEFYWLGCANMNMENTGNGWLYIAANNPAGGVDTSDQFLNYWWDNCKHWSTQAPVINASSGGSFHVFGLDCSDYSNGSSTQNYLFQLYGQGHARGVQNFECNGLRVEPKSIYAGLLYAEWADGNVAFRNVDYWSQAGTYNYNNNVITIKIGNTQGAQYTFTDSQLAGGITIQPGTNSFQYEETVSFLGCQWYYNSGVGNRRGPDDVVNWDMSVAGANTCYPDVVFDERCKSAFRDSTSTAGQAVWGAVIGQHKKYRQLAVAGSGKGVIPSTSALYYLLPLNALITRLELVLPAGTTTETTTGLTWSITSDPAGAATNIATATVSGAANAGAWIKQDVTLPVALTTDAARLIKLSSTATVAISSTVPKLIVHGYW